MIRTLAVMEHQDRGFDAQNVLTVEMPLTEARPVDRSGDAN